MKKYEITFVVSENFTEDRAADIARDVKKQIESHGGKVEKEVFWGKRKLIYKIAKNSFGYYYVFIFDIEPGKTNKLNKELNLSDKILRYLVVDFIEGSPFFEEGAQDKPKRSVETREEEQERKPRKFARKKPSFAEATEGKEESLNKEETVKEDESVRASRRNVETPEQEKTEAVEEVKEKVSEDIVDKEVEKVEEEKIAKEVKAEEEMEERKPARKQMTEEERKEQLEKKLAELLKDEEL